MFDCPNLSVPMEIMQHVVHVESSQNPFAIGVVGGRLARQPRNLSEAVATSDMLAAKGYNFSLGVAQVNRFNLQKYGLASFAKAFEPCPNLQAGTRILKDCYDRAAQDWGKAFSCYYSGNFMTGFREGYVQKIYNSMRQQPLALADAGTTVIPVIPAKPAKRAATPRTGATLRPTVQETGASSPNDAREANMPPKDEKFVF
ncbi:lytic transglycosylase domain-containing protein [Leeia oryzae]|uniref:lytic transglycosylase domain-containing protein n=1 Tax=Leeia oryzae TaxID=356662 RepID=UPI00036B6316|nr:lytic transglycosylase domain-containing protein [Leeia oryzae]